MLAMAVVITVLGTFISINKLSLTNDLGFSFLTGAATSSTTGVTNLTITSQTSITNQVNSIEFGSGYVNASCTACAMDSNGVHNQTANCCISFYNVIQGFLLENTGNINISVNYTCLGNCSPRELLGGTNPTFQIKATSNFVANQSREFSAADTAASCMAYSGAVLGGWNITNATVVNNPEANYTTVIRTGMWLCGNLTHFPLDFKNSQDAGVIDINLSIPEDAPAGYGVTNVTFIFWATSAG